jgi:4'-phosphopantetheinyl transferase
MTASRCVIWLLDVRDIGSEWMERGVRWMRADERRRCDAFVRPVRRDQFIFGRALLRLAIATEGRCAPRDVEVLADPGGPPSVRMPGAEQRWCSIAHSRDLVACAVAADGPIGLDVEGRARERPIARLSAFAFSSDEQAWIARAPDPVHRFYHLWTAREAAVKVRAQLPGVPGDTRFRVVDGALVPPATVAALHHIDAAPEYAMCLASAVPMARPSVRSASTAPSRRENP